MLDWNYIQQQSDNKCLKPKNGSDFKILSIDGGGIRGIFAAKYLAMIEEETGIPINKYFDLVTGTSTGGIIALGITAGIPMKEIVNLYVTNASSIFDNKIIKKIPILKMPIIFLKNLYDNKQLKKILKEEFGDRKIIDAKTLLCIPSLEYNTSRPKVYKTPHSKNFYYDKDIEMWKVALATSAAPLYFPPATDDGCKLDGGLWANNPILVGITEALSFDVNKENIKVLSIGTGEKVYKNKPGIFKRGGLFAWNTNIIDIVMNAQSYSAENISKYLIEPQNITRINFNGSSNLELDNINQENLRYLEVQGKDAFLKSYKKNECVEEKFF